MRKRIVMNYQVGQINKGNAMIGPIEFCEKYREVLIPVLKRLKDK